MRLGLVIRSFEQWLLRLETLSEANDHLQNGEHVSGPAADAYRTALAGVVAAVVLVDGRLGRIEGLGLAGLYVAMVVA